MRRWSLAESGASCLSQYEGAERGEGQKFFSLFQWRSSARARARGNTEQRGAEVASFQRAANGLETVMVPPPPGCLRNSLILWDLRLE